MLKDNILVRSYRYLHCMSLKMVCFEENPFSYFGQCEVVVKDVIAELKKHSPLVCDGQVFHVRCVDHILNC